ncbi:hypothetical protein QCA50_004128 [Cerrena zonata]|uniref:DUF6697 domain-containing protein n=1 Tax=Cerrena zonata TaxID=2478898 RepID=A0AAW0GI78_9APHY
MKPEKRKPTPAMAVSDVKRRKTDKAAGNHPNRGLAARSISDSVQSQIDSEKSISNVETLPKDVKPYPSEMRRAIQTVCNATGIDQKPEPSIIYGTDDFAVEEKSNEENAVESGGAKAKDKKKMKSTARPQQKIKVKKDEVGINRLPQNNVVMRLNGLAHYEVAKEIIVRSVARDKMSTKYGGSSQRFCPTIGPKFRHGHRFIFPTLGNNPDAPREPGKLGLLYRTTNERPWIEDPTKPKKKKTGPSEP